MHTQQQILAGIIIAGGAAVIASYVHGFLTHPATRADVWGGVPRALRPVYVGSMLLAAAGYFAFTYFVLFVLDPDEVLLADRFTFAVFPALYAAILVPSAVWMPLTFALLAHPGRGLWLAVRVTLALTGVASLALLAALLALSPREPALAYWFAVGGAAAFCIQTAALDMLVWPAFFGVRR